MAGLDTLPGRSHPAVPKKAVRLAQASNNRHLKIDNSLQDFIQSGYVRNRVAGDNTGRNDPGYRE
jgi:hypothetical protein